PCELSLSSTPGCAGGTCTVPPNALKATTFIPVSGAAALLVGSTTLFFVFTCPWLSRTISLAVPLYNGIIFLFVLANFSMATFMDSGVFPRATEEEDAEDDFRAPLYKNVEVKGIQVRMKWCASCHFYRPPRCSHCSVCDHCVEDFDHHCPWVNNCIGRRNYRYFFLFLLSLCVHMVGVFSFGLLFVLHHLECLEALHTTITLAVMCVSGLFFIPVGGLTGFHMVLVARGRTTNEQVTGKFKGGVNPFTRGCRGNVEYVLCTPLAPRYIVDHRKKTSISIQPPFLHLELSERQITFKLSDNGSGDILRTKVSLHLNRPSAKHTVPSVAPILAFLRGERFGLSAQALCKYRPSFAPVAKVHYCTAGEQVSLTGASELQEGPMDRSPGAQDCFSELELDLSDWRSRPVHWAFRGSPMQLDTYSLHSRSLSLRESHRHRERLLSRPSRPEACSPRAGSAPVPGSLFSRNGSLSYDSLLSPVAAAPYGGRQRAPFPPGNLPVGGRQSPCPGDQPPPRYESLSKAAMASIQERRETEERERLLALPDCGVYDTPRARSLHPGPCFAEGRRAPGSRSPTPPVFDSRDSLVGARARAPCPHSSSRSSVTSATSARTDASGASHHAHRARSTCSTPPRSPPTYVSHKRLSVMSAADWMGSGPQGEPKV
uniref:Palmitoyltransferase n=1 Tax=Scleropages formosus TaxID=113540 RepID=A0A8C9VXS0_SCLFO